MSRQQNPYSHCISPQSREKREGRSGREHQEQANSGKKTIGGGSQNAPSRERLKRLSVNLKSAENSLQRSHKAVACRRLRRDPDEYGLVPNRRLL
jgi:hypothetical protein